MKVKWESFHANFTDGVENSEGDSEERLVNQSDSTEDIKNTESFWQHELGTFQPNGLSECEVDLF